MVKDGGKRYYTAIKNISRLLSKLNRKTKHAYQFCMNCLNGFRTESARDKHYEYQWSRQVAMATSSSTCLLKKKKWLKCHDGQDQFKVPFMFYADFESILKPVDERYKEKMNTVKAERRGKAQYTEK